MEHKPRPHTAQQHRRQLARRAQLPWALVEGRTGGRWKRRPRPGPSPPCACLFRPCAVVYTPSRHTALEPKPLPPPRALSSMLSLSPPPLPCVMPSAGPEHPALPLPAAGQRAPPHPRAAARAGAPQLCRLAAVTQPAPRAIPSLPAAPLNHTTTHWRRPCAGAALAHTPFQQQPGFDKVTGGLSRWASTQCQHWGVEVE